MTVLLDEVTVTTTSSEITAPGPLIFSVTSGTYWKGNVIILADIGGGFCKLATVLPQDDVHMFRLEIPNGATVKAVANIVEDGESISVHYVEP